MARRDRHGRGLRRPLLPFNVPAHRTRREAFDDMVRAAAEDLERRWGAQWGALDVGTEEVPPSAPTPWEPGVPLGRLFPADLGQSARIVLYRRPIEARTDSPFDTADLVREVLAENVAHLLGKRPDEIDPELG